MLHRPPSGASNYPDLPSPTILTAPSPVLTATPDGSLDGTDTEPVSLSHLSVPDLAQSLVNYRNKVNSSPSPHLLLEFAHFLLSSVIPACPDVAPDLYVEVIKALKRAACSLPDAQLLLGEQYELGAAHPKRKPQFDKSFALYLKAAKHSDPEAAYRVAVYYENGRGTTKSNSRALQFYQKAAALGHPGACFRLGIAELYGELGMDINARNGIKWLKHSVANATVNHCEGLYKLALLHEVGIEHVIFVDHEYSVNLLQQAANLGHVCAMYRLGSYFEHGDPVPKDLAVSFQYYMAAAERGHPDSMFGVASWFLTGNHDAGVPQSDDLSLLWMKKAAEAGLVKAFYALAYLYEEGIGTEVNLTEAKLWYEKALGKGDQRAKPRLEAINLLKADSVATSGPGRTRKVKKRSVPNDVVAINSVVPGLPPSQSLLISSPPIKSNESMPSMSSAEAKKKALEKREIERERIRRQRTGEEGCLLM